MTGEAQPDGSGAADDEGRREIEWQLSAPDLGLVRRWLSDHGSVDGLTIEPRPTHTIYDTYLDTEDWRLRRAGFALRLRDVPGRAEATLKDLAPAVGLPADPARVQRTAAKRGFRGARCRQRTGQHPGTCGGRAGATQGPLPRAHAAGMFCGSRSGRPAGRRDRARRHDRRQPRRRPQHATGAASRSRRCPAHPHSLEGLVDQLQSECALTPAVDSKYEVGLKVAGLEPSRPRRSWVP